MKLLTITGPSGSGKDSLVDGALCLAGMKPLEGLSEVVKYGVAKVESVTQANAYRFRLRELISHTTRTPREGECNGVDYYFVSEAEMAKIDKVEETEYAGNRYCLSEQEVMALGNKVGIVIVDKHGVDCINAYAESKGISVVNVFVSVSPQVSEQRMRARGDDESKIGVRLKQQKERNEYTPAKLDGSPFDFVVYNDIYADALWSLNLYIKLLQVLDGAELHRGTLSAVAQTNQN